SKAGGPFVLPPVRRFARRESIRRTSEASSSVTGGEPGSEDDRIPCGGSTMRSMRLLRLTAGLLLLSAGGIACTQGADGTPVPVVHASNAAVTPLLPTNVLALPSFDPGTFQELLGQLRGTPVVVNVWASWCKPCEDETPLLVKAAKTYAGRVQFLGIDIQDARTSARTFQQRYRVPYPSVYDPTSA